MQDQSVYYVSGIYLPGHNLLSLPNTIAEMKHFRNLTISSNKIVYYPNEMFSMQTLEHFDISYMYGGLTSIPTKIDLPNLQNFHASDSLLQGNFPTTWNTSKLEK